MTNEKAKDFFSAYHEDTLEAGLRMSFEQKLREDGALRREYDHFVKAMDGLDVLKFEEIEIPHDLHERISAKLDKHLYDKKRSASPNWAVWLRGFAFAGIGAVAILGAVFTLNARGGNNGTIAAGPGFGSVVPAKDHIDFTVTAEGVQLSFKPSSVKTVIITNAGKETHRATVGTAETPELKMLLSNPLTDASVFCIQIANESSATYIILPGKSRLTVKKGEGTVVDLAKAVSGYYQVPVKVEASMPNEHTNWTFTTSNAVDEASKALSTYQVTEIQSPQQGGSLLEIKK